MNSESKPPAAAFSAEETDASLVSLIGRGDKQALSRLYGRYSKLVYAVALRVLNDEAIAEDVLQDVFMQVWRSPKSFAAGQGYLASLLAVASRNRAVDCLQKKRSVDPSYKVNLVLFGELEKFCERHLVLERVRGIITALPPDELRALQMSFFEGVTPAEIAKSTGQASGTVKERIRNALQSMGKAFDA